MESCLLDFSRILKSTSQYPEVFRLLRQGGAEAATTLDKFQAVLLDKTVPAISQATALMGRIKDSIKQTILHQQSGFMAVTRRLPPEDCDFTELCKNLGLVFEPEASAKGVKFSSQIEPQVRLICHREPLLQGIENLLKNALEATPPGGEIRLTCAATESGARLVVSDTGCGIRAEDLPRVMSVGFTTKPEGHGLGLHSFAVFLSSTGGRLQIVSEGTGQGVTVTAEICHVRTNHSHS
jgi:signal transduction histidine kinase